MSKVKTSWGMRTGNPSPHPTSWPETQGASCAPSAGSTMGFQLKMILVHIVAVSDRLIIQFLAEQGSWLWIKHCQKGCAVWREINKTPLQEECVDKTAQCTLMPNCQQIFNECWKWAKTLVEHHSTMQSQQYRWPHGVTVVCFLVSRHSEHLWPALADGSSGSVPTPLHHMSHVKSMTRGTAN